MVILTELGGWTPCAEYVSSELENIGPGSEEVKEVLSSLFSELSRIHVEEKLNHCLKGGAELRLLT